MRTLMIRSFVLMLGIHGLLALAQVGSSQECPDPEAFFGFRPGSDSQLFDYSKLIDYLKELDQASPRLKMIEVGASPMGKPMYVAFLSMPQNLDRLDELREINRHLALDPDIEESKRKEMERSGRVFVMATLSMHSTEVGPSQSLPLIAYDWCTTDDATVIDNLSQVVMMVVPNHNPDGMDFIVHHFLKYRGTKYEGCRMPGVYHKYVGHDNNRDFLTLTQKDTQVISDLVCQEWFPQALVEKHQMGSTGPRYFVPPNHDPISENIDEGLWRWNAVFGTHMAQDMSTQGLSGIASHWLFDNYWPGATETSLWKNVISFLTEAASCRSARPVFIEPNELQVRGKGLSEYKISANMPNPWPGGWWRLSDIVEYERASMDSILGTAALYRQQILEFRNALCRREVARGKSQAPYHFVIPKSQWDQSELVALLTLLQRHGIAIHQLNSDVSAEHQTFQAGDYVIPLAQPYRAFIKEVMEDQTYPVRHYTPDGKVIRPYDITSWSLPLHKGVQTMTLNENSIPEDALSKPLTPSEIDASQKEIPKVYWAMVVPVRDNGSYRVAFQALEAGLRVQRLTKPLKGFGSPLETGSFVIHHQKKHSDLFKDFAHDASLRPVFIKTKIACEASDVKIPRIGLVETYFHDMDAGWTRYLLDTYGITFTVLRPGDLAERELSKEFDVVIFPDVDAEILKNGKLKRENRYFQVDFPPEFQKGMGDKGLGRVLDFVDQGGTAISWRRSIGLFTGPLKIQRSETDTESFKLPIRDLSEGLTKKGLFVPGAFLNIAVRNDHPIAWGIPEKTGAFSRGTPVIQTKIPMLDMDRRVVATFPESNILQSGYAESEELLGNKPAVVWLTKGKGQIVLMAFSPQFRASTPATYKFLFNSILLPKMD